MCVRPALLTSFTLSAAIAAASCANAERREDIVYDDRHGERGKLDLYVPESPRAGGQGAPTVMNIHGGGWRWLSKDTQVDHSMRLAHAGYVVATINYRLSPEGEYPRAIQDCYCALGFLQANATEFGIDPERIVVSGYSAGGHLASLIAVAEPTGDFAPDCATPPMFRPIAVISGDGPQDLRELPDIFPLTSFLGGDKDEVPERYERASPVVHVESSDPPFLLIHGTDDWVVGIDQSESMQQALRGAGVEVSFLRVRGGHHLFNPDGSLADSYFPEAVTDGPEAWAATMDFLDEVTTP